MIKRIRKKRIIDVILGSEKEFSLKERIYNSLFFTSALTLILLFIGDIIQGLDFSIYIASFITAIFFTTMYVLSRKLKLQKFLIHIFNLILVAAFVYLWYYNGGLDGVSAIILIPMIGVIPLFVSGYQRVAGILFLTIVGLALLWFEINNPDFVHIIEDKQTRLIDKFITAFLISISVLGVVFLILHGYNKEHQKVVELNNSKNKLLSIIAHDLKNPIGTLNNLNNLLLETHNEMGSERRAAYIKTMIESTEGTYNLLENLLMWARSESGDLELRPEKLEVFDVVNNSVNLLKQSANQKNLKIRVEIEENLLLFADHNMIDTIIRNLVSNAIKFSERDKEIIVAATQSNKEIQISVKDFGVGMSNSLQAKIFNNEHPVSTRGTNDERGTGFGLKLCKEFVRHNNGKISIKSEEGIGTEIIVHFPLVG
jgi:two-component system sensor histidine kinase/response regulator